MVPKFSDSPDQILRKSCTASWQKPQKELISPLPCEWEIALAPRKNSVKYSFWNNPSLNEPKTCFATRLLNDSISWVASNYKTSEALSTQKTGWSSSLPLLPPQVLPCYQVTSAECHIPGLYCSPSTQTPHKTTPHRSSASSLDEWKLLKLL